MKLKQFKKRLLIIAFIILVVIALPITVYLVQQQQNLQQKAEAAKTLSLTPINVPAVPGGTAEFTLEINPQGASVKNIKFVIKYDPAKLEALGFARDLGLAFETKNTNMTAGQVMMEYGTEILGNYFSTQKTIGKLSFRVLGTSGSSAAVTIDSSEIIGGDGNPIAGFIPNNAQVSIGVAACMPDVSTCSWDPVAGATSYHYRVVQIFPEGPGQESIVDDNTTRTSVTFNSSPGNTYKCDVYAINDCGNGTPGSDTATCASPTPTLTPTLTPTPTPIVCNGTVNPPIECPDGYSCNVTSEVPGAGGICVPNNGGNQ